MSVQTESKAQRVLFEIEDKRTVVFRRSDMADGQIRAQLVLLLMALFKVDIDDAKLSGTIAGIPAWWGDFIALGIAGRERGTVKTKLSKARGEAGGPHGASSLAVSAS
jgi:hypothetical protein